MRMIAAVFLAASAVHAAGVKRPPPQAPEDLAPDSIDVSLYPVDMQETYREILLPYSEFHGGPRRFLFSPRVADADWKTYVSELYRSPPCCGACPLLSREEARQLWLFLSYDSKVRKTGANEAGWKKERRALVERFRTEYPEKYRTWLLDHPEEKVE